MQTTLRSAAVIAAAYLAVAFIRAEIDFRAWPAEARAESRLFDAAIAAGMVAAIEATGASA